MTVRHPDLIDYLSVAAEVTALNADTLSRVNSLDLADSAMHAPATGWAGRISARISSTRAAVLLVCLAKNILCPTVTNAQRGSRFAFSWSRAALISEPGCRAVRPPCRRLPRVLSGSGGELKRAGGGRRAILYGDRCKLLAAQPVLN